MVLLVMGGGLGVMIGLLVWDFAWKTPKFILLWSIIFAVFTVILLVAIFFGGRVKISNSRRLIHDKLARIHVVNTD